MHKKYKSSPVNISFAVLYYGCFLILCQVFGILLYFSENPLSLPHPALCRLCLGMLEYSLASLTVVVGGALLVKIASRR